MDSSFALQLSEIAAKSTNELDLKARKIAHSKSLIFEQKIAATQDFDTIYQLCLEGFEDLCNIDPRFRKFHDSLFSEHGKTKERDQMTAEQNSMLDNLIESCLGLLGGRLLLSPAVKVAEWLVRRFRAHEYNTSFLLLTFLPYHKTHLFRNLLSILPSLPPTFKFLNPYIQLLTGPPRRAIAHAATNSDGFFSSFNEYTVRLCRVGSQHQSLLSFWASIVAEAVAGRLDLARSGRDEIQRRRQEDMLLKILPLLKDGLSMQTSPEMVVACYTIAIILASKGQLVDTVLDSMMEAVTRTLQQETMDPGLICLSAMTQQKSSWSIPYSVVAGLVGIQDLELRLKALKTACRADSFALTLVQSTVLYLRDKTVVQQLGLVQRILLGDLLDQKQRTYAIGSLIRALDSRQHIKTSPFVEESVVDLLRRLTDSEDFYSTMADAIREAGVDPAIIEARLQSTIVKPEVLQREDIDMEDASEDLVREGASIDKALKQVQGFSIKEVSFLSPSSPFKRLLEVFEVASRTEEGMQSFARLPLWKSSTAQGALLFASFSIRVFAGPHALPVRLAALSMMSTWLAELSNFDSQAILPYVLLQLADPILRIRTIAAEVLLNMAHAFPSVSTEEDDIQRWGSNGLYDFAGEDQQLIFLSNQEASKVVRKAVLPVLEECLLDPGRSKIALQHAMKPTSSAAPTSARTPPSANLKKKVRQGFFRLILTHVSCTPLYSVRIGLLLLVENIDRVGSILKQNEMMPLLLGWAALAYEDAKNLVSAELLGIDLVTSTFCGIVSPAGNEAIQTLLNLCSSTTSHRPDLVSSVARRIEQIWPRLTAEQQSATSKILLTSLFNDEAGPSDRSQVGRHVFQSVELATHTLNHLLSIALPATKPCSEDSPALKRQRNNRHQARKPGNSISKASFAEICKITLILELVDSSTPEHRPELLNQLFRVLTALHQLKLRDQSELSYLLSLTLGSLLSIIRHNSLRPLKLEWSTMRLDVVIDCMRSTSNSQVQHTVLQLIAELASVFPERVLDSIMPIFTFMGSTVIGRNDEHSNFIVDHTMDKVIPPLVESFNRRNQDLTAKASDLVSSFVVAYEHIPSHRRLTLFKRLISSLGDGNFLWVVLLKLTQRYEDDTTLASFTTSLMNLFEVDVQLTTYTKLVTMAQDTFVVVSGQDSAVEQLEKTDESHPSVNPLPLLLNLDQVLSNCNIRSQLARLSRSTGREMADLLPLWENLVDRLIQLAKTSDLSVEISTAVNDVMTSVLRLLPIAQFVDVAERFVETGPEIIRRKTLRLLTARIPEKGARNVALQPQAMSFLQTLVRLLRECDDDISNHAAIACVDRICGAYGRKDIPTVLQAVEAICGDNCLRSTDKNVSTLALLCLSSLVELVREAIVPVVPSMISKVLQMLRTNLEEGVELFELYDAGFTLISALLAQVPYIFSEEYLEQIMALSAEVASLDVPNESVEIRRQTLQLIGKNIPLTNVIGPLQRTWPKVVENDVSAVLQALVLFSTVVGASSKSMVVENAGNITAFLLQALDLRRVQLTTRTEDSYEESDVTEVENRVNVVAIEFVYKLNDSTFRPNFLHFMDWATKCTDVKSPTLPKAKMLRQVSLFNFLSHFFDTLGAIVMSYASHIVEPGLAVLAAIPKTALPPPTHSHKSKSSTSGTHTPTIPAHQDELLRYLSTMRMLRASLRHDQDGHFSQPSLFTPLSSTLTSHLEFAATHPSYSPYVSSLVIPTIVALATAVIDTPDHLKSLNSQICNLRRSTNTTVRRASISLQLALVGAPDVVRPQKGQNQRRGNRQQDDREAEEKEEEQEGEEHDTAVAEEWCSTVLSVGEGMVYVSDLLEDDDPGVKVATEKLVRRVRDLLGDEEIF